MLSQEDDDSLDQASLIANLMNPQTQLQRGTAPSSSLLSSAPQSPLHSSGMVEMSLRPVLDDSIGDDESLLGPRGAFVGLGNEEESHPFSAPNEGRPQPAPDGLSKHLTVLNCRTPPMDSVHHSEDVFGLGTDVSPSSHQVTCFPQTRPCDSIFNKRVMRLSFYTASPVDALSTTKARTRPSTRETILNHPRRTTHSLLQRRPPVNPPRRDRPPALYLLLLPALTTLQRPPAPPSSPHLITRHRPHPLLRFIPP